MNSLTGVPVQTDLPISIAWSFLFWGFGFCPLFLVCFDQLDRPEQFIFQEITVRDAWCKGTSSFILCRRSLVAMSTRIIPFEHRKQMITATKCIRRSCSMKEIIDIVDAEPITLWNDKPRRYAQEGCIHPRAHRDMGGVKLSEMHIILTLLSVRHVLAASHWKIGSWG